MATGFQSVVRQQTSFGQAGELIYEAPLRANPVLLASTNPAHNVIGSAAVFYSADGKKVAADKVAGPGAFAGILSSPKQFANQGTVAGGTLAPNMTLPNNTPAEALEEGMMNVILTTTAAIGDVIYAKDADGTLVSAAPTAAAPANTRGPLGSVKRFNVTTPGLAVVHVNTI